MKLITKDIQKKLKAESADFFRSGWQRAYNIPKCYQRFGQLAYERLYERLRAAKRRCADLETNATP